MKAFYQAKDKIILAFDLRKRIFFPKKKHTLGFGQFWSFEVGVKLQAELILVTNEKAEFGHPPLLSPIYPFLQLTYDVSCYAPLGRKVLDLPSKDLSFNSPCAIYPSCEHEQAILQSLSFLIYKIEIRIPTSEGNGED